MRAVHLRFFSIGVALLPLIGIWLVSCKPSGVAVTVTNATGGAITNLQIKFNGGSKFSPKLNPTELFKSRIEPDAASNLLIEFADSSGKQHSAKVDVYLEPNYSGYLHITIEAGGKVTWKDDTRI